MKDEEKAEEYAISRTYPKFETNYIANFVLREVEGAFLAGLKAGRSQWHDLQKDPNDLPKEEKQYLCCVLSWVGGEKVYACLIYDTQYHSWKESYGDVIKWKEIE